MKRRRFLGELAGAGLLLSAGRRGQASSSSVSASAVRVTVHPNRPLHDIPRNFIGLGYEISSVATPGLLSAKNHAYVQLVRTLGPQGVIRVGGNTSDYATFAPNQASVSAPKGSVVNEQNLRELGTFLEATGWDLIWGLNLGRGSEQNAVDEARAVAISAGHRLFAFEIGNEPDLFGNAHRERGYRYEDFLADYRKFKAAIRKALPNVPLAGPDVATATGWVSRFATDEGHDLNLFTHHYYRECTNPSSTCEKLLRPDPKLAPELVRLEAVSEEFKKPYRICETNTFCGGGKPGVSDTFCSALWALDFLFELASAGAGGVNLETGVNHIGFISSYSPIGDDDNGTYTAKPEYYGALAFTRASRGSLLASECDPQDGNFSAYAALEQGRELNVTLLNKDAKNISVDVAGVRAFREAKLLRLSGPSLESKDGVELGGSVVDSNGRWNSDAREVLPIQVNHCQVTVPAASAAIVTFR